ncbi:MAG: SDR family oxidoreductase [Armatimonadetes bacterium]|nr:SDR family oxidoreductase [Armatimonadota bacterium]
MKIRDALLLAAGAGLVARELWKRRTEADLAGQVVLITGGSRGLGLALAREFGAQGCRLVICARDGQELARAREDLEGRGIETLAVPCDVTDPSQVERLIAQATERFGRVDVLVNNAGIISVGPVQAMTRADFEEAMNADFWGTLNPILAVLPQMRARRGGRIVNVTSIGGKVSVPHLLPYSCAKFAATALSEGLRAELARDGITVTTIAPGLMRTGSYGQAFVKGDGAGEYAWFSLSDNAPGLSISAARAAREIARATRRGEAERILSLPANVAARAQGLAPGTTADLLRLVNRMLPHGEDGGKTTGRTAHAARPSRLLDALTVLGRRAAHDLNQPDS